MINANMDVTIWTKNWLSTNQTICKNLKEYSFANLKNE